MIFNLRGEQTCRRKTNQSLRNKMKSVQQSVNVAITSSGWYKGLPQKCETSVKQRFPFIEGFQRIVL